MPDRYEANRQYQQQRLRPGQSLAERNKQVSEATASRKTGKQKPRLKWVDAPPAAPRKEGINTESPNQRIARLLRARPGDWALVKRGVTRAAFTGLKKKYKGSEWEWVLRPAGTGLKSGYRQSTQVTAGGNTSHRYDVYGRYVGGLPKKAEAELAEQHEQESAQDSSQSPAEAPQSGDTPQGGTSPQANGLGAQEPVQSV